jgi:hypothetical protein
MPIRRSDDTNYTLGTALGLGQTNAVSIKGGEYIFMADGTISVATVALQVLMPNNTWSTVNVFNASPVSFSTLPAAQTSVDLPPGSVRVSIAGTSASGVNCYLVGLG